MNYDVVVVGGGITGLAAAWELSKLGLSVCVLEKGRVGEEQSSRNWGLTRQQARHPAELPIATDAIRRWERLSEDLGEGFEWRRSGTLRLTADPKDIAGLTDWIQIGDRAGVKTEILQSDAVRRLVPYIESEGRTGFFTPSDGNVEPQTVVDAYRDALASRGVAIHESTAVTEICRAAGRVVSVRASQESYSTSKVVVAAGTWSRRLLRPLGLNLPIQSLRSSVAITRPLPRLDPNMPVWTPGCAFRQRADGRVLFARAGRVVLDVVPSAAHNLIRFTNTLFRNSHLGVRFKLGREFSDDLRRFFVKTDFRRSEPRVDSKGLDEALATLRSLVPAWRGALCERSWAGYIDGTPDSLPIISDAVGTEGLVIAAGFSGHGFGLAPSVGKQVADLLTQTRPEFDMSPFSLRRFSGNPLRPTARLL